MTTQFSLPRSPFEREHRYVEVALGNLRNRAKARETETDEPEPADVPENVRSLIQNSTADAKVLAGYFRLPVQRVRKIRAEGGMQ